MSVFGLALSSRFALHYCSRFLYLFYLTPIGSNYDVVNQLLGRPCRWFHPHDSRVNLVWTLIWKKMDGTHR